MKIADCFEGEIESVCERFVTLTKPVIEGNKIKLGSVYLTFENNLTPKISTQEVQMHGRMKSFANGCNDCETVFIIDFESKQKSFTFQIDIE